MIPLGSGWIFGVGLAAGCLASVLGWQINIVALHRGLENSRRACFMTGLGALLGDVIFIVMAFLGSEWVVGYSGWENLAKLIGAPLLIISGVRLGLMKPKLSREYLVKKKTAGRHFLFGLLVVIGNPVVLFIWLTVASYLRQNYADLNALQLLTYYLMGFVLGGIGWFLVLTFVVLRRVHHWEEERLRGFARITAVFLIAAACLLLFERF